MNDQLAHYLNRPVEQHNKDAFIASRRVHVSFACFILYFLI